MSSPVRSPTHKRSARLREEPGAVRFGTEAAPQTSAALNSAALIETAKTAEIRRLAT